MRAVSKTLTTILLACADRWRRDRCCSQPSRRRRSRPRRRPPRPQGPPPRPSRASAKPKTSGAATAAKTPRPSPRPRRRPAGRPGPAAGRGGQPCRPLRCGDRAGARSRRLAARSRAACARRWRQRRAAELPEAKASRDKIADPAARKLVDWYLYRGGYGTAPRDSRLPDANPAWPDRSLLTQRAEEALFNSAAEPARHQGLLRRRRAHAPPSAWPRWRRPIWPTRTRPGPRRWRARPGSISTCPPAIEPAFLKRVGAAARPRPTTSAASTACCSTTAAGPASATSAPPSSAASSPLLSEDEKKKAEARLAVFLRAKNSQQADRPSCRRTRRPTGASPCRRRRRCAGRRRRRRPGRSCWRSRKAPGTVKPDGWWEERRASAYAALQARQAQDGLRSRAQPGRARPSMPARTRRSWPAGWRCATSRTPSWRSAISRRWPRRPTGR